MGATMSFRVQGLGSAFWGVKVDVLGLRIRVGVWVVWSAPFSGLIRGLGLSLGLRVYGQALYILGYLGFPRVGLV